MRRAKWNGRALRAWRKKRGIGAVELSARCGVSRAVISRCERNVCSPDCVSLLLIWRYTGLMTELFDIRKRPYEKPFIGEVPRREYVKVAAA